jgi:uncharacterized repeat protein (TIGR04076 family)
MTQPRKVKIKVLKVMDPKEVFPIPPIKESKPLPPCDVFKEGQEFIIESPFDMPKDFCSSAWFTLFPAIRLLAFGGDYPWVEEPGKAVLCCIDGLRPVIFKLERI